MKALFRNHFPFVEGVPEEELTPEQLITKKTYDKLYPNDSVSAGPVITKDSGQNAISKTKGSGLRKVHADERSLEGIRE